MPVARTAREARLGIVHQLGPLAKLDDAAVFDDQDVVGSGDGGQSVGDDDAGPVGEQLVDGAFDQRLRRRIEAGRCLIENDETGVSSGRSG